MTNDEHGKLLLAAERVFRGVFGARFCAEVRELRAEELLRGEGVDAVRKEDVRV